MLLFLFAFFSGLVTVLAPCIWPLLPIILSASVSGGRRKPLGIVTGLVVSFTFFTLALSYLVKIFPFDPEALRLFAVIVIGLLGLSLLVPRFGTWLETQVSRLAGRFGTINPKRSGFGGGFVTGLALGLVWTPCAGPILAAIATLAATQSVTAQAIGVTLAFAVGVAIPLFVFAVVGQRLLVQNRRLAPYTGRIQQVFGAIMLLTALAIYTGYDKTLQTKLLDLFPGYSSFIQNLEGGGAVQKDIDRLRNSSDVLSEPAGFLDGMGTLPDKGEAPDIVGIEAWLNTEAPLTLEQLKGKVILVDFWTYSCINCIRTLPHVTGWYEKYKDAGFVVLGVHTPEFEFEKKQSNVEDAIKRYKIHYPVALDNAYTTWRNYNNRYWPARYLIDAKGRLRYTHFGEGKYEETEANIRALLTEAGQSVEKEMVQVPDEISRGRQTPETYLGLDRMERFASSEKPTVGTRVYTLLESLRSDSFAFAGTWVLDGERATAGADAELALRFRGNKVFLVMAPGSSGSGEMRITLDGQSVGASAGRDVENGKVVVDADRLYELVVVSHGATGEHTLSLQVPSGVSLYAFTFGS